MGDGCPARTCASILYIRIGPELGLDRKGCLLRIVQELKTKIPFHKIRTLFVLLSLLLAAWLAAAQVTSGGPADRVYRNGVIFTADAQHRTAEGLAIRDGRILYIGNNQGLAPFVGSRDRDSRSKRTVSDAGPH